MKKSKILFKKAQLYIPGGVNSPVRAFKSVGGTPVFFKSAKGSILTDVDNKKYIDYIGSWGPMILGHCHPPIIEVLKETVNNSTSFGAPTEMETKIAELITKMVPAIEKIRMVNSGTEACMSAIRLARAYTKKEKFIKFEGCYHGHADPFLIKAGSGAITLGIPNSPGVTKGTAKDTLLAPFNNIEVVKNLIKKNDIAAIILEPVAGNMGCIPPKKEFIEQLRALCTKNEIVLIFDEVMTGFRLAKGGASEIYNIEPDLVTLGKIIGAGLPVGAFGGKKEIMDMVAPNGEVYQAGTLSGNPIAMNCGYTLLNELNSNNLIYDDLEDKSNYLERGLHDVFNKYNLIYTINRVGSMLSFHFDVSKVNDFEDAKNANSDIFKDLFHASLKRGVYFAPSAFESLFISTTHHKKLLDETINIVNDSLKEIL